MDEYIKREDVIKHLRGACIAKYPLSFSYGIFASADEISKLPPANVVPKSEIVNILDGLMKEAREIADRYEKSANETSDYDYARIEYRGCQMGALLVLFKIAELKKKYTEESK